jgi:hypothetical protein
VLKWRKRSERQKIEDAEGAAIEQFKVELRNWNRDWNFDALTNQKKREFYGTTETGSYL